MKQIIQVLVEDGCVLILYNHKESSKTYGLKISPETMKGMNLESLCSWIDKCKRSIARQVYKTHDLILEDYEPSHFERSKLSSEDYLKKCQQDAKEHNEKEKERRKFLNEPNSILLDIMMGIRST